MTTQTLAPSPAPTGVGRRIVALDVLRGIAILGTLATNIGIFTTAASTTTYPRVTALGEFVGTVVGLITDGKFIGLLTIMFGIGMEIQRQSALRRGDTWLGSYPWRAALLVLDGLLNYIFIFEFDVLMGYGLTGLVMCVVFARSPRFQKIFMVLAVIGHLAFLTWMALPALGAASTDDAYYPDLVASGEAKNIGSPAWDDFAQQAQLQQSSYWAQVVGRVTNFWNGRGEIPIMLTMGMGLYLVGAFLYRNGLFEERGARLRRWIMGLSFGIGLPVDWITRLYFAQWTGMYNRYFTSACVSIGLLALVAQFYVRRHSTGTLGRWVSYVGKMALTCYLAQNLIASILFYDWGFGLATKLSGIESIWVDIAAWLVISAILISFSAWWLRRYSRGPVELVWHKSHAAIMAHMPYVTRAKRGDWAQGAVEEPGRHN